MTSKFTIAYICKDFPPYYYSSLLYLYILSYLLGLGRAVDTIMQHSDRSVKNAEAENLRIEGKYIASKAIAELFKVYNEAKNDDQRVAIEKFLSSLKGDLTASEIAVNDENIKQKQAQTQLFITENLIRRQELNFLPYAQKLQLSQGVADIALKYAQKDLTEKQARHEVEKLAETVVRANGQALQNQFDADTYDARVITTGNETFNLYKCLIVTGKQIGRAHV